MASVTVTAALTSYAANNKMAAVTIADTSANIATNLNALLPLVTANKITSITQTGTASALAITATQLTADATVLAKITGTYTLAVSGVTAGGTATVVANTHVTSLAVTDSAANMTTNLTALIALGTKLTGITESGTVTAIALTAAQYTTAFTAKFTNFTTTVSGVTATIAATAQADAKVATFTVSDTAANITTNLAALIADTKLTSITETGTVTAIALTAAQYTSAFTAKLSNFTATVSGVTAGNATTVGADAKVASMTISDSSANIATNLNALLPLVTANKITSITQTGTASALAITATQLTADATVLAKITGTYTLAVSGVTAGGTATVVANTHVT